MMLGINPSRSQLVRSITLVATLIGSTALAYGIGHAVSRPGASQSAPHDPAETAARNRTFFPSGQHLIAYVVISSTCGFSAEKGTQAAISKIRQSLKRLEGTRFAKVTVVGVAIDNDLEGELKYLRGLSRGAPAFDELSVGGSWLNEQLTQLVWRDAKMRPATPTVLAVTRAIDATGYPTRIAVQPDSVVLRVEGRDNLIAWVNRGTPIGEGSTEVPAGAPTSATTTVPVSTARQAGGTR